MGEDDEQGLPPSKRLRRSSLLTTYPQFGPSHLSESEDASSTHMAARLAAADGETVGSRGQIRKVEFVRIITQALYSLGYHRAAAILEEESGIPLQSSVVTDFRDQILAGRWDQSVGLLQNVGPLDLSTSKAASFLILQQKFLESLHMGDMAGALKTLRTEISPLDINIQRVHELASCVVCPSREELLQKAGWRGPGAVSRSGLLCELQELLPPSVMIPEKRLEHLVEQALEVQKEACTFHNTSDNALSLYVDHRCGREQIPTRTLQVLEAHDNEVWFLQFSHDGRHLASASKDCTAIIWEDFKVKLHASGAHCSTGDSIANGTLCDKQVVDEAFVKLKHTLTDHQKPVSFVAWSPDDSMLLTCGNEEVVKLWNAQTGECRHTYDKPSGCFTSCAWFPDGQRFVSGGNDKCIYMWDLEGNELESWKGTRMPRINDLAITLDGSHMVSLCGDSHIRIYNLNEKTERVIEEEKSITSLSVSKDGRYLLVNLVSQEIHLWDISANSKLPFKYRGHRQGRYVIRSCFGGSDHAFIVSGSEDSQVYIWHRRNGELLEVLPGHSGTVNCVSWNPSNPHMFASASDDHTIRIWGLGRTPQAHDAETSNGIGHLVNGGTSDLMENLRPFGL